MRRGPRGRRAWDLQDIQEALGHAVITTTTMYAHLTTRRQREQLAEYLK